MSSAKDVALYLSSKFHRYWDGFSFFDLQRLLYLAQGWHLASRSEHLFPETIGAHEAAPLTYSIKGVLPASEMLPFPHLEASVKQYLDQFCLTFSSAERSAVRRQVEREDGAWALTKLIGGEGASIHPELMKITFRSMVLEHFADVPRRSNRQFSHEVNLSIRHQQKNNVIELRV